MSPTDLLTIWPSQAEIARALGVKPPSVAEWFENKLIPDGRQYQIELASAGRLKADKPPLRNGADPNPDDALPASMKAAA